MNLKNIDEQLIEQLQKLAVNDWKKFSETVGNKSIVSAKILLLREKGKTYGEIANTLNLTRRQIKWIYTRK